MHNSRFSILLLFFLSTLTIGAQERLPSEAAAGMNTPRQLLNQAENDYNVGRIEQAVVTLRDNIGTFQGTLRQSACRLLALCYLSQDQVEEAQRWAEQLMKLNRYYNSTDDPARFQDLINQLREDLTATITTASNQSESIHEAPAPVTIITAEMIEELGYNRNLNQILAAYVPGMAEITTVNGNTNLAMHGAYAEGQELVLIMENGHRLNSRFDNRGSTSYSISTEKIDHIEVLRGPASSLYGNVAVSAVVNIITKSGRMVNGVKAKYGHGSFGTHRADLLMGTQLMDADILAWASIYHSDGQQRTFPDDDPRSQSPYIDKFGSWTTIYPNLNRIYVDGYKDPPAYDVGLRMQLKGFNLLFTKKNVKKVLPFNSNPYSGGYDYGRYFLINGMKPGDGEETTHAELGYTYQKGHLYVNGTVYSDWYKTSSYEVQHDSIAYIEPSYDEDGNPILDENGDQVMGTSFSTGRFTYRQFREHTIGGQVKAGTDYSLARMKGHLLAGAHYEHFSLLARNDLDGKEFTIINDGSLELSDIIDMGKESSLSFFLQDKHYLLPQLILNAGARYDFKYRRKEDVVRSFSPRLALMYVPTDRFSLKLSYSEAFADLSFYFRYIFKPGDDNLVMDPQHLSAVQLTSMGSIPQLHLSYEANLFYNKYTNLLCWQARDFDIMNDHFGDNQGQLTTIGLESSATYTHNRLSAGLSLYCARDLTSSHYFYNRQEKIVNNVPHVTVNLHGAWKLLHGEEHQLKTYGHATYTGRRLDLRSTEDEDSYLSGNLLLALGLQYRYRQHLQLSLDCENIFNTDHYLCSMDLMNRRYIQRGRTLMAAIAFQF